MNEPRGIVTERSGNLPYARIAGLALFAVVSLVAGLRGVTSWAGAEAATMLQGATVATSTQTLTPEPTATETPNYDLIARDQALRQAAESEATAAALGVDIIRAAATSDEIRKAEAHSFAMQATARAIATQEFAQGEAISLTLSIAAEKGAIEIQALETEQEIRTGAIAVGLFCAFLAVLAASCIAIIRERAKTESPQPAEQGELPDEEAGEEDGIITGYGLRIHLKWFGDIDRAIITKTAALALLRSKFLTEHWRIQENGVTRAQHEAIRSVFYTRGWCDEDYALTESGVSAARLLAQPPPLPIGIPPPTAQNTAKTMHTQGFCGGGVGGGVAKGRHEAI